MTEPNFNGIDGNDKRVELLARGMHAEYIEMCLEQGVAPEIPLDQLVGVLSKEPLYRKWNSIIPKDYFPFSYGIDWDPER